MAKGRPGDKSAAAGARGVDRAQRAAVSDEQGLRDLWKEHRRWVAAILLAHMPRDADLEDLLQDVALAFVKHAGDLADPAALRPWLRTVARNVALNAGRKRQRRLRLVRPIEAAPEPATPDAAASAATREQAALALQAAQRLDPRYAEPLLLRCAHRLTYQQIAAALDVPVTTVETRIARARRMLREELEKSNAGASAASAG